MKTFSRSTFGLTVTLVVLLLFVSPSWAQEDESGADDEGWGKLLIEYGTWIAQPEGIAPGVATIDDPFDPFDAAIVAPEHGTETEHYARFGADFARNLGRFTYTRYAHESDTTLNLREPSNFIFGELLAYPAFAGYANDGFADAVEASHLAKLTDSKIEFSRIALDTSRVEVRWVVGLRRVKLISSTEATYHGLVPPFPAVDSSLPAFPPDLIPLPDLVEMESRFDGRGLSGGMEIRAPLGTEKLMLEVAVNAAVLVGDIDSRYRSENHFYSNGPFILEAPYAPFSDSVRQVTTGVGLRNDDQSTTSEVLEVSLGGRWAALEFMDVFLGFRATHYGNVALDMRPTNVVVVGSTANLVDSGERLRSVTYEGFYAGVGFRF